MHPSQTAAPGTLQSSQIMGVARLAETLLSHAACFERSIATKLQDHTNPAI